jgi:transcriptional regulator with XRE-family HTH domain
LAERLYWARVNAGFSVADVARDLGVDRQRIYAWERRDRPADESLFKLAKLYAVDVRALLGEDREAVAPAAPTVSGEERSVLHGRSLEIEALLAFAMERQRLLSAALGRSPVPAAAHTELATPQLLAKLDATVARQQAADTAGDNGPDQQAKK